MWINKTLNKLIYYFILFMNKIPETPNSDITKKIDSLKKMYPWTVIEKDMPWDMSILIKETPESEWWHRIIGTSQNIQKAIDVVLSIINARNRTN